MFHWRKLRCDAALTAAWLLTAACGGKAVVDAGAGGSTSDSASSNSSASNSASNNSANSSTGSTGSGCDFRFPNAQSNAQFAEAFDVMVGPDGNCAAFGCHEPGNPTGFVLFADDPKQSFTSLVTWTDSGGALLANPDRPLDSWLHCFILPDESFRHGVSEAGHLVIEDWLHNGAVGP